MRLDANKLKAQPTIPSFSPYFTYLIDNATFRSQRHLIFNISPGLAGSGHLALVLGYVYNTRVFHQPLPLITVWVLLDVLLSRKWDSTIDPCEAQKLYAIWHEFENASHWSCRQRCLKCFSKHWPMLLWKLLLTYPVYKSIISTSGLKTTCRFIRLLVGSPTASAISVYHTTTLMASICQNAICIIMFMPHIWLKLQFLTV